MEKFYLDQHLAEKMKFSNQLKMSFDKLCNKIQEDFTREWNDDKRDLHATLQLQKKAIIGYKNEVAYFIEKINSLIKDYQVEDTVYPPWYKSLADAIYHENWGLAGVSEWFSAEFAESSSAKIIGDRIYFLQEGIMKLMPQKISKERREQLIRAFLLLTPEERLDKEFHEIYLLDGTRITIFGGQMTKQGQDVIIFRRYIIPKYTFEEQASRGTIPEDAIPLFRSMVDLGYNVAFVGAVRTAKTTFLSTWQSYEDPNLEGVMVETDPEIPMHSLIPEAPIIQLIADDDKLRGISKNLLRSDADYFIMAEARDGNALDTALRIASKGTRRMKITFHLRDPLNFPKDMAWEIVRSLGGDVDIISKSVALSFDYVFHFIQLKNKNKKRLNSIYELSFDRFNDKIIMNKICAYNHKTDNWSWSNTISKGKKELGEEENLEAFNIFSKQLSILANRYPMKKNEG
jgi:pilus assembly protein CpaF